MPGHRVMGDGSRRTPYDNSASQGLPEEVRVLTSLDEVFVETSDGLKQCPPDQDITCTRNGAAYIIALIRSE